MWTLEENRESNKCQKSTHIRRVHCEKSGFYGWDVRVMLGILSFNVTVQGKRIKGGKCTKKFSLN